MNDAAARLGLEPGMALADARAMYPALAVAQSDEEADRRLLEAVADWCDRYTPLVGLDAPDGLMLDVAGCAHLFGGEAAMRRDILRRLATQNLQARAAVADTPSCAWAVAHYGASVLVVPPGQTRDFLAPLPLAALRLAPEVVAALAESGLKRVADVLDLPRAVLAARFDGLLRRLDQALGRQDEPITPRLPVPSYVAEQRFAEPIALERDVLGTIARLAVRLGRAMEARQDGARVLEAALFRTDGEVFRIKVGTGAPLRDPERIGRLFADKLAAVGDACDPGFGYDLVRLSALATERCEPVQTGARFQAEWTPVGRPDSAQLQAAPDEAAELTHLIDRLGARFGLSRVTRLVPQDTHIPEFAVAAMPAHAVKTGIAFPGRSAACFDSSCPRLSRASTSSRAGSIKDMDGRDKPGHDDRDTLLPSRPVRLFERPEPIEAIAEVPDGPPVRFRWRRVLHEVAAAEGPERIAMEWWRDADGRALTRDYFRVQSREGFRAWLFREGLFGRETDRPRWFLHGLFG